MIDSNTSTSLLSNLRIHALSPADSGRLTHGSKLHLNIIDNAARYLAEQVGLSLKVPLSMAETQRLERSDWVDEQVIELLQRYPQATVLELNSGVSTRFHRLSRYLDWPQFRWADVNAPEIAAFAQTLLPITDNYRQIACSCWDGDWLARTGWNQQQPLIVLAENLSTEQAIAQWHVLQKKLGTAAKDAGQPFMAVAVWQSQAADTPAVGSTYVFDNPRMPWPMSLLPFFKRSGQWLGNVTHPASANK